MPDYLADLINRCQSKRQGQLFYKLEFKWKKKIIKDWSRLSRAGLHKDWSRLSRAGLHKDWSRLSRAGLHNVHQKEVTTSTIVVLYRSGLKETIVLLCVATQTVRLKQPRW